MSPRAMSSAALVCLVWSGLVSRRQVVCFAFVAVVEGGGSITSISCSVLCCMPWVRASGSSMSGSGSGSGAGVHLDLWHPWLDQAAVRNKRPLHGLPCPRCLNTLRCSPAAAAVVQKYAAPVGIILSSSIWGVKGVEGSHQSSS